MDQDESTPTTGAPYRDTPEVVPSDKRMPVRDPYANTAASKRSRGARQTSRGAADQRQGDTAPYEEVSQGKWRDDLEKHSLDDAEAREAAEDETIDETIDAAEDAE